MLRPWDHQMGVQGPGWHPRRGRETAKLRKLAGTRQVQVRSLGFSLTAICAVGAGPSPGDDVE